MVFILLCKLIIITIIIINASFKATLPLPPPPSQTVVAYCMPPRTQIMCDTVMGQATFFNAHGLKLGFLTVLI